MSRVLTPSLFLSPLRWPSISSALEEAQRIGAEKIRRGYATIGVEDLRDPKVTTPN